MYSILKRYTHYFLKNILFLLFVLPVSQNCLAQYQANRYDTSYYVSYRNKLVLGTLFTKKNTAFKVNAPDVQNPLRYLTNTPTRFGFSAAHDFISLSGTVGLGGLDPSYKKEKGQTKSLNLQLALTGRKILADIYFQSFKGLYLNAANDVALRNSGNYYIRPDVKTNLYGTTVLLIQNNKKFTAQAPFLLDGWQKKSAGSLLFGGETFYGTAKADSAFIPTLYANFFPNAEVSKLNFITFGPGIGYGHSFIIHKHFFITGIASANANVSYIKEWNEADELQTKWKFNPNIKFKGAVGYNTEKWGLGLSYASNRLFFKATENDGRYLNYNDNYKLMFTRRINAGKTIPQVVGWTKKVINKMGLGFLVN